jgi:hypothetical protein
VPAILYGQTSKVRESFVPGTVLVHFRGDHTYYWVHPKSLRAWSSETYDDHMTAWRLWCAKRPNYMQFYEKVFRSPSCTWPSVFAFMRR